MKISSISMETVSATAVHIHNGRKHVNEDVTFLTKKKKKECSREIPSPFHHGGYKETSVTQKRTLPWPGWNHDLRLLGSRTVRNKLQLFTSYPVCGISLKQSEQT